MLIDKRTAPQTAPMGQLVTVATSDGRQLNGTMFVVPGSPYGAVLLHMYGGKRQDWLPLQKRMRERGISSIAIDYRGNEGSGAPEDAAPYATQHAPLFEKLYLDAFGAKQYLLGHSQVHPKAVAYIGASVGTTTSIRACEHDPDCPVIVLLSPGLDYLGVNARPSIAKLQVPVLMTFAQREWGEPIAADTLRSLHPHPDRVKLVGYDEQFNDGHGTHQFALDSSLLDLIIDFIQPRLQNGAAKPR